MHIIVSCIASTLSGFAGSNAMENLELFSIVDAAADAWVHVYDANFHEKNEELKVKESSLFFIHPFYYIHLLDTIETEAPETTSELSASPDRFL